MTLDKLSKIIIFVGSITLIALIMSYAVFLNLPSPSIYSFMNQEGSEQKISYLTEPVYSDNSLLSWVQMAVTTVFKMDFVNYQESLANMKVYFTQSGYNAFLQALNDSNFLADVIAQKLEVSAVVTDTPIILSEGGVDDYYFWVVELPVLITFVTAQANETPNKRISVRLLIERVSTKEASIGIGINRFWMRDNVL